MEGIENNKENDSDVIKKFLLEISGRFKTSSTVEFSNYQEALELFNQHSKDSKKKNVVLYEVHKSTLDGSTVKKVPVLNTSKHAERLRELEDEEKRRAFYSRDPRSSSGTSSPSFSPSSSSSSSSFSPSSPSGNRPGSSSSPNQKNKMTFANMKNKIIILVAVVVGFIALMFILDFIASLNTGGAGGGAGHHIILYDSLQNYIHLSTTISGWSAENNQVLTFNNI
jgi:hypothetical protein